MLYVLICCYYVYSLLSLLGTFHLMQCEHDTKTHGQYAKSHLRIEGHEINNKSAKLSYMYEWPFSSIVLHPQHKKKINVPRDFVCKRMEFLDSV